MNTIVLDECLTELYEAGKCIDMIKEIDPYSEIFEASNEDVKTAIDNNEKAKSGAVTHLRNAAKAVLNMIQNLITSIREFIAKRKMDADERKLYDAFKEACKKDPSLKNKKITVTDFRKVNEEYQKILKDVEDMDKKIAEGKVTDATDFMNSITDRIKGMSNGFTTAVTCEVAIKLASSSREISSIMLNHLENDEKLQKVLIDNIGEKETKNFEKDLKSLSKRISFKRWWMTKNGQCATSAKDAINKTITQIKEICKSGENIAKTTVDLDVDASTETKDRIVNTGRYIKKHKDTLVKDGKNIVKNSSILKRAYGNKDIKDTVKTGAKVYSTANKDAKEYYRNKRISDKKPKRTKGKVHDQSALQSLLGLND